MKVLFPRFYICGKSVGQRELSVSDKRCYPTIFETVDFTCGFEGYGFSVQSDEQGVSFIEPLFGKGPPATVVRTIPFVVVASFKRLSWRLFSHIGKEVIEASPPVIDRDPPAAVILPIGCVRVGASLCHVDPRGVGRWRGFVFGKPVCGPEFSVPVREKTAARLFVAGPQFVAVG